MTGRLTGRVALVTGAAGDGIGRATAWRLGQEGATVVVTDVHEGRTAAVADALADELEAAVLGLPLDVSDRARVDVVLAEVHDRFGPVDVLVNNAAVNLLGPVVDVDPDDWDRVIAVDLTACWYLIRAVLPGMYERGRGAIVNVSSVAAWVGSTGGEAPYAAAKSALLSLTRTVAAEAGPKGVRCNAVAPGFIASKFLERHAARLDDHRQAVPLRRFGQPEEVAGLIAFLASDEASYITGEAVNVSGGWYMRP